MGEPKYPAWATAPCEVCGVEGQATRAEPADRYVCEPCEVAQRYESQLAALRTELQGVRGTQAKAIEELQRVRGVAERRRKLLEHAVSVIESARVLAVAHDARASERAFETAADLIRTELQR